MHSVVPTVLHIRRLVLFHKAAVQKYWKCDSIWEKVDFKSMLMHWQVWYIFRFLQSMVWQLIHSIGTCRMRWFLAVLRSFFHSSLLLTFFAILLHQLFFHLSLHLAICFLVYLSFLLFPNSYIILFWEYYSILCTCPNQCNLFNLIVSVIVHFLTRA